MQPSSFHSWFLSLCVLLWSAGCPAQSPDFAALVKQTRAVVVNISGLHNPNQVYEEESSPLDDFLDSPAQPRESIGSGFIVGADGYILTNTHVVEEAEEIYVSLFDRREFPAEVVGSDKLSDIALLKIAAEHLPVAEIGDSSQLEVGQWVLAIGSPFGFDYSATKGIVSALSRSLPDDKYVPFIQSDAAVNPGNSGGPLFNLQGQVVGVNSQIFTGSGGYMGLSFAIPINLAMRVAEQLKTHGRARHGWLGAVIQAVSGDLAKSFGLAVPHGALISQIMPHSPAAEAGLQAGDIILAYNDKPIDLHSELPPLVGMTAVDSQVSLRIQRAGAELTVAVTIRELSDDPENLAGGVSPSKQRLKILVAELNERQRRELDGNGVVVENVIDGPSARAGLQSGDIILKLNHQDIETLAHFERLVAELPVGQSVPMLVQREQGRLFLALTLPEQTGK